MRRTLTVLATLILSAPTTWSGASGQGATAGTPWCDMTQAQRDQIKATVECLPADQRKVYVDVMGSPVASPSGKWEKSGSLCLGTSEAGSPALARTIYDEASGKVIGVVLFPAWFQASMTNQKFSVMQEGNRIKDGPLYPQPNGGKVTGSTPAEQLKKLEDDMWILLNNLLVLIRDARSRMTFVLLNQPSTTTGTNWLKELCANLKSAEAALIQANVDKLAAKAKIAEAKAAGVNTSSAESKLKDEVCKQLTDEFKKLEKLISLNGC